MKQESFRKLFFELLFGGLIVITINILAFIIHILILCLAIAETSIIIIELIISLILNDGKYVFYISKFCTNMYCNFIRYIKNKNIPIIFQDSV